MREGIFFLRFASIVLIVPSNSTLSATTFLAAPPVIFPMEITAFSVGSIFLPTISCMAFMARDAVAMASMA